MPEPIDYDKIEDFLMDKLSIDERIRFENEMDKNSELKEKVKAHKMAFIGLKKLVKVDLGLKFNKWEDEFKNSSLTNFEKSSNIKSFGSLYLTIGFIVLLLCSGLFYFFKSKNYRYNSELDHRKIIERDSIIKVLKNEVKVYQDELLKITSDSSFQSKIIKLQNENIQLRKALDSKALKKESININIAMAAAPEEAYAMRGIKEDNDTNSIISSALNSYNQKMYSEAVSYLKRIDSSDAEGQRVVLYVLPYALFYAKEFGQALVAFEKLGKIERAETDKVNWYILLCYVAENKKKEIQKRLKLILENPQNQFHSQANDLNLILKNNGIISN